MKALKRRGLINQGSTLARDAVHRPELMLSIQPEPSGFLQELTSASGLGFRVLG